MIKPFTKIGAVIFSLMALLHAARLAFGWEAHIAGHTIPVKASIIFVIAAGVMAWGLWREARSAH